MAKDKDTGDQSAQDQQDQQQDQSQDQDSSQDQSQDQDQKKGPFTPEQEQYLGSWFGRIVAKQIEDKVLPLVQQKQDNDQQILPTGSGNEAIDRFNQDVMNKWLAGDALGAYNMLQDVSNKARTNLTQKQKTETDRLVVGYSEKPYYKDIFKDMKTMAHDLVGQGYPPQAAVDLAYSKASLSHLEKTKSGDTDTENLGMLEGGKKTKTAKKLVLPPHFKDACERDIEAGLFKDEQEWIANLAPSVRKAYELE
jgi:hypothetical protein